MIVKLLYYIKYQIIYYVVGFVAILEDIFGRSKNKCDLILKSNDVAVITGGARGIGAHVVEELLRCDMHVIIGCRNVSAGSALVHKLRENGLKTGSTSILPLDLQSTSSVRAFAEAVLKTKPVVNILINNAGIMFPPYKETEDGFESQWGVNYVGHFLLTHLLLPRLISSAESSKSRIINVSSCAHIVTKPFDFSDLNMKKNYIPTAAYAQSKAAQIMFTQYLDRLLQEKNYPVRVYAVHPGIVDTEIFNETLIKILCPYPIRQFLFKRPEEGATSIVYACISPELENTGGVYISNCEVTKPNDYVVDKTVQNKLFEVTKDVLNIEHFGSIVEAQS